jgi:transposase
MLLRLSPTDYQILMEVAHSTHDPRQMHRAQALLWLHEGDTVDEVATRLFVTPRTVFRWRSRFHERQSLALPARLADGPRSSLPKTVHGIIDTLISEVIHGDPRQLGYHATVWTAPSWLGTAHCRVGFSHFRCEGADSYPGGAWPGDWHDPVLHRDYGRGPWRYVPITGLASVCTTTDEE